MGVTFEFHWCQTGVTYGIPHTASLSAASAPASDLDVVLYSNQLGVADDWERVAFTVLARGTGFYRISASPN